MARHVGFDLIYTYGSLPRYDAQFRFSQPDLGSPRSYEITKKETPKRSTKKNQVCGDLQLKNLMSLGMR